MGLDMYLMKRGELVESAIDPADEKYDYTDVAYWRKANAIHNWFLDALDLPSDFNCGYARVNKDILEDLMSACQTVLDDNSLASALLPTCYGFFFGDTEYDEYYFDKLQSTIDQLEKVIKETDWDNDEIYYSCWW